jgi:hypothetical protein
MKVSRLPHSLVALSCNRALIAVLSAVLLSLCSSRLDAQSILSNYYAPPEILANGLSDPPYNVAVDKNGNAFVADANSYVKEFLAADNYATVKLIGGAFDTASGVALDASGNLYVVDFHTVSEALAATGYTTINTVATGFGFARGIALDSLGNIFVSDPGAGNFKEILAGTSTPVFIGDSTSRYAFSLAVAPNGDVYFGDPVYGDIFAISAASGYTTVQDVFPAGWPWGVAFDADGSLYISSYYGTPSILKVQTIGGIVNSSGYNVPELVYGFAIDPVGGSIYYGTEGGNLGRLLHETVNFVPGTGMVDFGAVSVGKTSSTTSLAFQISAGTTLGAVSVWSADSTKPEFTDAGGSTCVAGTYSTATTCQVNVKFTPQVAGLRNGGVIFADNSPNIRGSLPLSGTGTAPQLTFSPGTQTILSPTDAAAINFNVAQFGGNLYSTENDGGQGAIVQQSVDGGITTLIGGALGIYLPSLAVDIHGNIFVADNNNQRVVELVAANNYSETTLAAVTNSQGVVSPMGIAVDPEGNVFVASAVGNEGWVYEVPVSGNYTTATAIGGGLSGSFGSLAALALDVVGNVYVIDSSPSHALKEILKAGDYSTVLTLSSKFLSPSGLKIDDAGNLYIYDANSGTPRVFKYDVADPPLVNFPSPTPVGTIDVKDSPLTVTLSSAGNEPLLFSSPGTGTNPAYPDSFPKNAKDQNLCMGSTSLVPGESCDISANFRPAAAGAIAESLVLTDNALNVENATQAIPVTGTGTSANSTITFPVIPAQHAETTLTLIATASSGLPVAFASKTPSICAVEGTTASFIAAGVCTIEATQGGNGVYPPATPVSQSFLVHHATQTIDFPPVPAQTVATTVTLNATSSSGLPVSFLSLTRSICTVNGDKTTMLAAGSCHVVAYELQSAAYFGASVCQTFTVHNKTK